MKAVVLLFCFLTVAKPYTFQQIMLGYGWGGDGGLAVNALLSEPSGLCVDSIGNIYVADSANTRIRKIFTNGTIVTVAGNGFSAYSGDNGPATAASFRYPTGVFVDNQGNILIADGNDHRIRKVHVHGNISTVAGTGVANFGGDFGPAITAQLKGPVSVWSDAGNNIYVADSGNKRIRKVFANGTITTIAVTTGTSYLEGLSVDNSGNVYFCDTSSHRLRKILVNQTVTVLAGNGSPQFTGDGGPAIFATLNSPRGVAVDPYGNIFIADTGNYRIRKISVSDGTINSIAASIGSAVYGLFVDNAGVIFFTTQSPTGIAKLIPPCEGVVVGSSCSVSVSCQRTLCKF